MELTTIQTNLFLEELEDVELLSDRDFYIGVAVGIAAVVFVAC